MADWYLYAIRLSVNDYAIPVGRDKVLFGVL